MATKAKKTPRNFTAPKFHTSAEEFVFASAPKAILWEAFRAMTNGALIAENKGEPPSDQAIAERMAAEIRKAKIARAVVDA